MTDYITLDFTNVKVNPKSPYEMSNLITKLMPIARDNPLNGSANLYWYDRGVYKRNGEAAIRSLYLRILKHLGIGKDWRAGFAAKMVECITSDAPFILDRPDLYNINLRNGIYDWRRGKLIPHTPTYRTIVQLPITYNPTAKCPSWDDFLHDLLPDGEIFLIEVIALCMIPFTKLQKCIVLVGKGKNGKSTYLKMLESLVGEDNCCHVSLHNLTSQYDRFSKSRLVGKLVNTHGDLPPKTIEEASTFKQLTGEDAVELEYKGKGHFSYKSFARLIFGCNTALKSDDDSEGYKRRFIQVPFIKTFAVDPAVAAELESNLLDEDEVSGLFNLAVSRLPYIVEGGFTISPLVAGIIDEWCSVHDRVKQWFLENVEYADDGVLPSYPFFNYYLRWCPAVDPPFTRQKAIREMKAIFPGVEVGVNTWIGNKQRRCYRGVRLRDKAAHQACLHNLDYLQSLM